MKDNENLVICRNCIKDFSNIPYSNPFQYRGFYTNFKVPENRICSKCNSELYETKVTGSEIKTIFNVSHDDNFLLAMIDLKEKDIIEYTAKLSQFKSQVNQQTQQQESNKPKCPTCGSTKLSKVSTISKAGSVALWGLFSQKVKKTWHCSNCGYEW